MEEDGRERILANLDELLAYTICDADLLMFCYQKGVLGVSDIDEIATLRKHTDKANKFYRIMQTRINSYLILLDALRKTDQAGVAEILETGVVPATLDRSTRVRQILYDDERDRARIRLLLQEEINAAPCAPSDPIYNVSPPVPLFTGRRKDLEELHQKVQRSLERGNEQPVVISQLTTISGLGGIGKTQLSRQYVQEFRQHFDDNCVWLHAETEGTLGESFRTLAKDRLGLTTKDADGTEKKMQTIVGDVYRFFQDRKCLFIFDNAEKEPWLKQFLPQASSPPRPGQFRPCILITSRTREWEKGIEVIDLNELELGDAIAMVKKGLGLERDACQDEDITMLVKRLLQCFPLAMQQAISFIEVQLQVTDYSVSTYLEEFEKQQEELLSFDEMNSEFLNDYNMTTLTTWKMTVDKIGEYSKYGDVALRILYAMAYLSPEKVERGIFIYMPHIPNEKHLIGGVRLLVRFSMVRGEDKQRLLSVHRLVQEVTRIELANKTKEMDTLTSVLTMLGSDYLNRNSTLSHGLVNHLLEAWRHAWKFPKLIQRFCTQPATTITKLVEADRAEEVLDFANEALRNLPRALGPAHIPVIINTFNNISFVFAKVDKSNSGRHLILMRSVMELWRKIYGEEHQLTHLARHNLGLLCNNEFLFEEAYSHLKIVYVEWQTRTTSKDDTGILHLVMLNLGLSLIGLGRAPEALVILQRAYKGFNTRGERLWIIHSRIALGKCWSALGNFNEALKILNEDVQDMSGLCRNESTEMIELLIATGKVLRCMGDYIGAMNVHRQAHKNAEDIYGFENHKVVLMTLAEIGVDLSRMGQHLDAISFLKRAVNIQGYVWNDPMLIRVKMYLADALTRRGLDEDLELGGKILMEQNAIMVKKRWEKLAVFKNDFGEEIKRIQDNIALIKHVKWILSKLNE